MMKNIIIYMNLAGYGVMMILIEQYMMVMIFLQIIMDMGHMLLRFLLEELMGLQAHQKLLL